MTTQADLDRLNENPAALFVNPSRMDEAAKESRLVSGGGFSLVKTRVNSAVPHDEVWFAEALPMTESTVGDVVTQHYPLRVIYKMKVGMK